MNCYISRRQKSVTVVYLEKKSSNNQVSQIFSRRLSVIEPFSRISFLHIPKETNIKTDDLSASMNSRSVEHTTSKSLFFFVHNINKLNVAEDVQSISFSVLIEYVFPGFNTFHQTVGFLWETKEITPIQVRHIQSTLTKAAFRIRSLKQIILNFLFSYKNFEKGRVIVNLPHTTY